MEQQTKYCPRCGEHRPISEFYINKGRSDGLTPLCREHHRKSTNESARRKRKEFIEALGGKCEVCGFDDYRALQVDHINSDGAIDRIENRNSNSNRFKEKVLSNRGQYALLCANCNTIKKFEKEEWVGRRVYDREVPSKKLQGIGNGNAPGQREALRKSNEARRLTTHCGNGHELCESNVIWMGGRKRCKKCVYETQARSRAKR